MIVAFALYEKRKAKLYRPLREREKEEDNLMTSARAIA